MLIASSRSVCELCVSPTITATANPARLFIRETNCSLEDKRVPRVDIADEYNSPYPPPICPLAASTQTVKIVEREFEVP